VTPDFGLDDTDAALADAAAQYVRERYAFNPRRRLEAVECRFSAVAWREIAEMGWLAVATPEALGGVGLRITSIALLAQAAGRGMMNEPLLSTGFVAADTIVRHGSAEQQAAYLPALLAGDLRVACAFATLSALRHKDGRLSGRQEVVLDADIADRLLVQAVADGELRWFSVDAETAGLQRERYPLLDGRGAATLIFDRCEAEPLREGSSPHAGWLGALACAADACGAMEAAFELTLDYLKTRRQFGVPIGSFQVLQHRAVDQYMRLVECRAVLAQAVQTLQHRPDGAGRDVHAAKAFIGEQARLALQGAVQLHGGIGITDEYALSHYLRRVRVDEQLFGSAEQHLRHFAAMPA
jgi:alkylation response protein AidB-like acyl-CoA dehydrogenase